MAFVSTTGSVAASRTFRRSNVVIGEFTRLGAIALRKLGVLTLLFGTIMVLGLAAPVPWAAAVNPSGTWTVTQALGHGAVRGFLDDVACPAPGRCVAVGSEVSASGNGRALVETWRGSTWRPAALALPSGRSAAFLFSVACPSSTSCVAVGYAYASHHGFPLIETLSAGNWSVTPAPTLPNGASDGFLNGVACTGPSSCVAVGDVQSSIGSYPWAVSLVGRKWRGYSSVGVGSTTGELNAVSCPGTSVCVAVGSETTPTDVEPLVLHLQAGDWAVEHTAPVTGPDPNAPGLNSVACRATGACVAVGEFGKPAPVILAQERTTWATYPAPAPGVPENGTGLWGIACPGGGGCFAVGAVAPSVSPDIYDGALPNPHSVLIERQSSAGWAFQAPPDGLPPQSGLRGIACAGGSCAAVGMTGEANASSPTFSAHTLALAIST